MKLEMEDKKEGFQLGNGRSTPKGDSKTLHILDTGFRSIIKSDTQNIHQESTRDILCGGLNSFGPCRLICLNRMTLLEGVALLG